MMTYTISILEKEMKNYLSSMEKLTELFENGRLDQYYYMICKENIISKLKDVRQSISLLDSSINREKQVL
jgi:UDP-galactopyranose mutase